MRLAMLVAAAAAVAAAAPLARADHEEGHEPLAPAPVDEGVHDHSSHDHGTGVQFEDGSWMIPCACIAIDKGWALNCSHAGETVGLARATLVSPSCWPLPDVSKGAVTLCLDAFHIMQSHQQACPHDSLDTLIKKEMHAYEHLYQNCWNPPPFYEGAPGCPPKPADCSQADALGRELRELNCTTKEQCASSTECGEVWQALHAAYFLCDSRDLPVAAKHDYHDFQHECHDEWKCNAVDVDIGFVDDCHGFGESSGHVLSTNHTSCPKCPEVEESSCIPGDFNGDGVVDIDDLVGLTAYVSNGGSSTPP